MNTPSMSNEPKKASAKASKAPKSSSRTAGSTASEGRDSRAVYIRLSSDVLDKYEASMRPGETFKQRTEYLFMRDIEARRLTNGEHKKPVTNEELMEELKAIHEQVVRVGTATNKSHLTTLHLIDLMGFIDKSSPTPGKIPQGGAPQAVTNSPQKP